VAGSLFPAYINPLTFFEVEDGQEDGAPPTVEAILDFATTPGGDGSPAAFAARCRDLQQAGSYLVAAPREQHILDKLVWPLRHAKASYCLGNFLGTIALGGMVSEMVAITYFEATDWQINGQPMTEKMQRDIWGDTFEKLGQDRRVRLLHAYGLLSDALRESFDRVRLVRKRYLHLASQGHASIEADARDAYAEASKQVATLIGQGFDEGRLVLNPVMVRYLSRRGLMRPAEAPSAEKAPGADEGNEPR
jgi:hypothetical protein